nr:MAG TPA: Structural protein [Caudoviricetes sp.]
MAGRISELTDAAALTGAELLEVTQGGNSRKTTAATIAALVANEQIDDRVAALLVAGSGVTITYNDASNTLTIAATGGGSSTTVAVVNDAGTARTLATADAGKMIRHTSGSATTDTIPTNASDAIPVESVISIRQVGAGQVTVTPAGGVTLNTPSGLQAKTRAQGSSIMLHKVGTNEWDLTGDLASV